jgi:hypothetical protein
MLRRSCIAVFGMASLLAFAGSALAASAPNPPWSGLPVHTSIQPRSGLGDPINLGLEGSKTQVLADFARIGWVVADPLSRGNDLHLAEAALRHGSYPHAPVSKQFLFGRLEDFAVEHELGWVGMRDHARFWDTGRLDPVTHRELWVGAASRDIGITVLKRHHLPVGTTHRIDGNLDTERNLVVQEMETDKLVAALTTEPGVGKTSNGVTGGGSHYRTDGKVDVAELK